MKVGELHVPLEVVEAAQRVTTFFAVAGIEGWLLAGCGDRNSIEAYRKLHLACLRMWVASSDEADATHRVAAPQEAWKAMGDAMNALSDAEKYAIVAQIEMAEAQGMKATADKLVQLAQGRKPS